MEKEPVYIRCYLLLTQGIKNHYDSVYMQNSLATSYPFFNDKGHIAPYSPL